MQHIILVGHRGVGKSTLIRALTEAIPLPKYGVITKKEPADELGYCPVYIHLYGAPKRFCDENRIGLCRDRQSTAFPEAFDRFAEQMRFPQDGVIIFDELGFMESKASRFTSAVLKTLDTAPFCICAVRDQQTDFLDAVRSHPRADVYTVTEKNRDALKEMLLRRITDRF